MDQSHFLNERISKIFQILGKRFYFHIYCNVVSEILLCEINKNISTFVSE